MLGFYPISTEALSSLPRGAAARLLATASISTVIVHKASASLTATATVTANWDFRIFAGTHEFITRPDDAEPNRPVFGTLQRNTTFERSVINGEFIGGLIAGLGEMDLVNTDGSYDYLIRQYGIDGRGITLKAGVDGDAYDNFITIYDGVGQDWSVEEDFVRITLRDRGFKLEVPIQTSTYGGTGGIDGPADLAGKRKPRAFGPCSNVEPALLIPSSLTYQVNDGPVNDIPAVYVRGVSITKGADYANSTLLAAATVASGTYATCLAAGLFRINFTLDGLVTADVNGDATGGVYVTTYPDIVKRIIDLATGLVVPGDLYLPSFTDTNAAQPAALSYFCPVDDGSLVSDVIAKLARSVGGYAGFRNDGKFQIGIITAPDGATPIATFTRTEMAERPQRNNLPDSVYPPPWRFRVGYQRIYVTQTDLAGSVSADRRGFLAEAVRLAEASSVAILGDHPIAGDRDPVEGYFANESDAQTEANRLLALFRSLRSLYRIVVPFEAEGALDLEIGSVISVTYPRWDLTTGRNMLVVGLKFDLTSNTVEITGFG